MITLDNPWILAILPLPFILRLLLKEIKISVESSLLTPMYDSWSAQSGIFHKLSTNYIKYILASIIWLLFCLSASNPIWVGDPVEQPREGRELMVAMDISGSMDTRDMKTDEGVFRRVDVVKAVLTDFVSRRKDDKLGLILFGQQAFLQTPLTFDHKTIQQMLDEAIIGLAGAQRTAIGDAIGLTVKRLEKRKAKEKTLILLTDGANNTGSVPPEKAAELAAQTGIKIYTIGVGADSMEVRDLFGSRSVNPSADLDEKSLIKIADLTGGKYFRAKNPKQLQQIYQLIDKLEPSKSKSISVRPKRSLFFWPLYLALGLAFITFLFYKGNEWLATKNNTQEVH